ncbi:hypothetical protein A4A49_59809, partial [Nicotiana attenuata]
NMFCNYWQKPGHTIEKCFKLHGYRSNFKSNKPKTFHNQHVGDIDQHSAFQTNQRNQNSRAFNTQGLQIHNPIGISQEQYSHLMDIPQQVKIGQQATSTSEVNVTANCAGIAPILPSILPVKSFIHSWILDTGASEHMNFDKSILFDTNILPYPLIVNLPYSYKIKVTHAGRVTLFPDLVLNRVLFVPSFKFNLLSVHK